MGPFGGGGKPSRFSVPKPPKPQIITVVKKASSSAPQNSSKLSPTPSASSSARANRKPKAVNGHVRTPSRSLTPARPSIQEQKDPVKQVRTSNLKRSSPAVSTPRFSDSDPDEEDEKLDFRNAKRAKLNGEAPEDLKRRIVNNASFEDESAGPLKIIHAADIANYGTNGVSDTKYGNFFEALEGGEEDEPTVELQYPGSSYRERYNLVRSRDPSDFQPLNDIINVVKTVASNYVPPSDSIAPDDPTTGGVAQRLETARSRGFKSKAGAQTAFISALDTYNSTLALSRGSGVVLSHLSGLHSLEFSLIETILNQIYTRTVSPSAHLLTHYENGTSFVYGELLPRFMSTIFRETRLNSSQVFVDLGSGVGNAVLQAALEIGAEGWGCEYMKNPCDLAEAQSAEFVARCALWGLAPGDINLLRGDFLIQPDILAVLKRADVVLINNRVFTADLNDKLKWLFLDLKEGCQIVSLRPFREVDHKIQERHVDDPVNVLQVVQRYYPTKSVSWSEAAGDWYLSRKDSKELEDFRREKGLG
jgi:[histone H3]-lysine79 N-trimethyltransferase